MDDHGTMMTRDEIGRSFRRATARVGEWTDGCRTLAEAAAALGKPTLNDVTRRMEREHFAGNPVLRGHRNGRMRLLLDAARRHPATAGAGLLAAYVLCMGATLLVSPASLGLQAAPGQAKDYFRDFQNVNVALLSAQAALVALVYPLVIALVGTLFDARSTTGSRLDVFLTETEAVATGASALFLCAATSLPLVALAQVPLRMAAAITVLNSVWFVVNLFGIAFFVRRSLDYIRPAGRADLLRKYAADVAWRADLRRMLRAEHLGRAVALGHIASPPSPGRPHEATVSMGHHLGGAAHGGLEISLPVESSLIDVRLSLLDVAARSWSRRIRAELARPEATRPRLRLLCAMHVLEPGRHALAQASGGKDLTLLEAFLVRRAYRFAPADRRGSRPVGTVRLLEELASDLLALVRDGKALEFRAQLDGMSRLHSFLLEAAQPPDAARASYALDGMPFDFGTLGSHWVRCYREVLVQAVERMATEGAFFRKCSYLASSIHAALPARLPRPILAEVGRLGGMLFWAIRSWADVASRKKAGDPGEASSGFELAEPHATTYHEAWRQFIGGWEDFAGGLLGHGLDGPEAGPAWAEAVADWPVLSGRFEDALVMVGACAWSGDLAGTRWSVDLLLNLPRSVLGHPRGDLLDWEPGGGLLEPGFLSAGWDAAIEGALPGLGWQLPPSPRDLLATVVHNTWLDARLALVCVLVRWSLSPGHAGAASEAALRLLRGQAYDPAAEREPGYGGFSAQGCLLATIRVLNAGGRAQQGWPDILRGWVEGVVRSSMKAMVPNRIYAGSSPILDVEGLAAEQAICLVASPFEGSGLSEGILRTVAAICQADDGAARRIRRHLAALRASIKSLDPAVHGALVARLRGAPDHSSLSTWQEQAESFVSECIEAIDADRLARVLGAPIDPGRAHAVATAAGSMGFSRETAAMPIPLFRSVALMPGPLEEAAVQTSEERGLFTMPVMSDKALLEADAWAIRVRDDAARVVWQDVLQSARADVVPVADASGFWQAVRDSARILQERGLSPVLLIAQPIHQTWILEFGAASHSQSRVGPDAPQVRWERPGPHAAYVAHLGEVPVYTLTPDGRHSFLLPRELLDTIHFSEQSVGLATRATVTNEGSDPPTVSVRIAFERTVALGPGRIVVLETRTRP